MELARKFYRCDICGNLVELIEDGGGELVCCGEPMRLLEANTTDAATEKHVPVCTRDGNALHVVVGSVAHPMLDALHPVDLCRPGRTHPAGRPQARPGS